MEKVIFYGAGQYVRDNWRILNSLYNPIAFCDKDENKWGRELYGIRIYSPQDGFELFSNNRIVITLQNGPGGKKLEAEDYLVNEYSIKKDRIINYEDYYYGKGCIHAQIDLFIQNDKLQNCCENPTTPNVPFSNIYEDTERTISELLIMKRKTMERIRDYDEIYENTGDTSPYFVMQDGRWRYKPFEKEENNKYMCEHCRYVSEGYWSLEDFTIYGIQISSNSDSRCNFKCSYCCEAMPGYEPVVKDGFTSKMISTIKALQERRLLSDDFGVCLANGEPALYPDLISLFSSIPNAKKEILTNASIYSESIQEAIKNGKIVMSLDSGTRETFFRIKGVDCFETVKKNLKRYRQYGDVVPKFIVMPSINDNAADIKGFIAFCHEIDPIYVEVVRDYLVEDFDYECFQWSETTMRAVANLCYELEKDGFKIKMTNFPTNCKDILDSYIK